MSQVQYKITVEKIEEVETSKRGEYCVISKDYATDHEYQNLSSEERKGYKHDGDNYVKLNYGYAPDITITEIKLTPIYTAQVLDLDVTRLVSAVYYQDVKVPE